MKTMETMKAESVQRIPLAQIKPSPFQARTVYEASPDWPEFAASIQASGVTQPCIGRAVNGHVELVNGHRRLRASAAAKLADLPVIVRALTDEQVRELLALENLQREGLSALDEAQEYANWREALLKAGAVKTVDAAMDHIAGKIGRKRSTVFGRLALLKAAPGVRTALAAGKLDASKAQLLAGIPDEKAAAECLKEALEVDYDGSTMSVRTLKDHIERQYQKNLNDAAFDLKAAPVNTGKFPGMVNLACAACPHKSGMKCASPACFAAKTKAHGEACLAVAQAKGQRVLTAAVLKKEERNLMPADRTCYEDGKYRDWRTLAKQAGVKPALAVNEEGEVLEVFTPEDRAAIKAACKITSRGDGPSGQDEGRKRMKLRKANQPVAHAATAEVLAKLVPNAWTPALWRLLADAVANRLDFDRETQIAYRRGLAAKGSEVRDAVEGWLSRKDITARELQEFIVEALLCADWDEYSGAISSEFKKVCALAGVKLKTATELATAKLEKSLANHNAIVKSLNNTKPAKVKNVKK